MPDFPSDIAAARRAGDRAALVGVRQLGHPLQGVRAAGVPRNPFEKIADAAQVHKYTGLAPSVALHIPWDKVDNYAALRKHAEDHGVALGTINSNTFQDDDYKLGSVTHSDARIRQKAIDHHFACIDIMHATGSRDLKIWLADGTNYPGQDDIRARQDRLADSLQQIYARIGQHQRLVLEYKFFEPAFYHTDVPDWGTAYAQVAALGERALVCLDTGHHAAGDEHRIHRRAAAALGKARLLRFQLTFLCGRRSDRRRGGSVPTVSHPVRSRPRRRLRLRDPRSPSCSINATTSKQKFRARSAPSSTCRK